MKMMKKLAAAAMCGVVLMVAACNTTKGVGQDIQTAGEGIKDAAQENGAR